MDGKTKAIVAHIFWIGWLIALIINSSYKDEITSFYIRQLLGIYLFHIAVSILIFIPPLAFIGWIATFVFWILSLIGAVNGEMKETPIVGKYFQDWFKGI
jgi:uncharacterized membrane protein